MITHATITLRALYGLTSVCHSFYNYTIKLHFGVHALYTSDITPATYVDQMQYHAVMSIDVNVNHQQMYYTSEVDKLQYTSGVHGPDAIHKWRAWTRCNTQVACMDQMQYTSGVHGPDAIHKWRAWTRCNTQVACMDQMQYTSGVHGPDAIHKWRAWTRCNTQVACMDQMQYTSGVHGPDAIHKWRA